MTYYLSNEVLIACKRNHLLKAEKMYHRYACKCLPPFKALTNPIFLTFFLRFRIGWFFISFSKTLLVYHCWILGNIHLSDYPCKKFLFKPTCEKQKSHHKWSPKSHWKKDVTRGRNMAAWIEGVCEEQLPDKRDNLNCKPRKIYFCLLSVNVIKLPECKKQLWKSENDIIARFISQQQKITKWNFVVCYICRAISFALDITTVFSPFVPRRALCAIYT